MERTALRGRLTWQFGRVIAVVDETPRTKSLMLDMPEWAGHFFPVQEQPRNVALAFQE